ncbi:MAG: histidinol-phosphate transaminase [Acidimicrobiia bacterium]|nr:histidinol-phosphate transaminase [Acidimicrobiia bacterium]MXX44618.1 histidinol-phosphate transaminase [Acidimicrobiia bacterium]
MVIGGAAAARAVLAGAAAVAATGDRRGPSATISTTRGRLPPRPNRASGRVVSSMRMEFLRSDLSDISVYKPGPPLSELSRRFGFDLDSLVEVATNENPYQPLEEVREVMARAVLGVNRYPDINAPELGAALAGHLGVGVENLWCGAGSSELIRLIALAVGGPGREAVFGWPSFAMYPLCTRFAMMTPVTVPLTAGHGLDPDGILSAIGPDTVLVYVCNPNNPSGTYLASGDVLRLIEEVPERVLVVMDEAYHEYATASDYRGTVAEAAERPNLVTLRTFSKIYGMAAMRVGYAVGSPETLRQLRKVQSPFTVSSVGQAGATEALRHQDRIAERVAENARERDRIQRGLVDLEIPRIESQGNYIYFTVGLDSQQTAESFLRHGVRLRAYPGDWARVTVGTPEENDRFLAAAAEIGR